MNIAENISLRAHNTFGIEAMARYWAACTNMEELQQALQFATSAAAPLLILGGGSNILLTKNFDGLVVKNDLKGISPVDEDKEYVYLKVGAGENWHSFTQYCIQKNLAGVENLSLIPGNAGASPMQNIGAYGVEIKDVFHSLQAYHIRDKQLMEFNLNDCEFGYRESVFKNKLRNQFVITSVTYRLNKNPVYNISYGAIREELDKMGVKDLSIANIAAAVIHIRQSKLPNPAEIGNAGSFFKNPEVENGVYELLKKEFPSIVGYDLHNGHTKLAAGWLIEQCGWKGYRKGDAGCHAKQALVLVNYGLATGANILALSEAIIASVKEKFGVELHREVNIV